MDVQVNVAESAHDDGLAIAFPAQSAVDGERLSEVGDGFIMALAGAHDLTDVPQRASLIVSVTRVTENRECSFQIGQCFPHLAA
jgi:hypothetical protein